MISILFALNSFVKNPVYHQSSDNSADDIFITWNNLSLRLSLPKRFIFIYILFVLYLSLVNKLTDTFGLCFRIHGESAVAISDFHAVGLRYVSTAAGIVVGR